MDKQLLIQKYQPINFNQLKYESDIDTINILKTLINMNNLNILFIGDVGSGKTTYINCIINEYYSNINDKNNSEIQSDIQENILYINSLKEQGINYYRNEVRIFCQTCSSIHGKKKIVVLDDIDLISEQSQQAFRNFIDKYSHNVHFIASCCNTQKVIESLQSRLIIMKIKQLSYINLYNILEQICFKENIIIDNDAKDFIISLCNNSPKLLIGYLEKFKLLNEKINFELASKVCTNISFIIFDNYTNCILKNDIKQAIDILYNTYDKGYSVMDILDNYFLYVKTNSLINEKIKYKIIPIICKYIIVFHNIHEDEIELALFTNNLITNIM
jgi:DNA polymerase III delta prime subunit